MLKPIPGFPGYLASEDGNIWSMKTHYRAKPPQKPILLKGWTTVGNRYRAVGLWENGECVTKLIHELILITFVGPRPHGMDALHGAAGSLDNSINNLRWGTKKENSADRLRDGTDARGEKCSSHILTTLQVHIIRHAYSYRGKNGLVARQLADVFGVATTTIFSITGGYNWRHIK